MINLLFKEEKEKNYVIYRQRRVIVLLITVLSIFVIIVALLAAFYTMLTINGNLASSRLAGLNEEGRANKFSELSDEVKTTNAMLEKVKTANAKDLSISSIIPKIINDRGVGVRISSLIFAKDQSGKFAIETKGVAMNRKAVVSFGDFLAKQKNFSDVKSPISNLIKSSNNDFVISFNAKP